MTRTDADPVAASGRISAVDTLRGFALLGILPVNIAAFALPLAAYVTPVNDAVNAYRGPFRGLGALSWLAPHVVCDLKMMTIFSMLFGAGVVLMDGRDARASREPQPGRSFAKRYYARLVTLLVFGLCHGLFVWYGDILLYYAVAGVVLYPLRRLRPGVLIAAGLVLFAAQLGMNRWEGKGVVEVEAAAERAEAHVAAGGPATDEETETLDEWESIEQDHDPTLDEVASEVAEARSSATSAFRRNTEIVTYNWTSSEFLFWCGRALTAMLLGMGLMKLRVFAAARSTRFYATLLAGGYGIGLPLVAVGVVALERHQFDPGYLELTGRQYNFVGSLFVALGHVGLVMLLCKRRSMPRLTKRLGAVGQMALTNYLAQSILCVALFSGMGLGLFGRFTQAQLFLWVVGLWLLQLAWSPFWLSRFRYGPAEWLWRSATYGRWEDLVRVKAHPSSRVPS